ncbi:MAG: tRNA (adenosine(37)-N6)-threonylcarbamoyltransferase complex ATPase subunit type 1 TsaE [Planctomycetota bacterium]
MEIVRRADSLEATAAFGRQLSGLLRPGDIIAIEGDLGAGKTTLVRSIVGGLGLDAGLVSSPTFVVANEYPGSESAPPVVHVDAYRLSGSDELDTIGWDRILTDDSIVLIEWPSRIASALPAEHATVRLVAVAETSRRIELDLPASWTERAGLLRLAQPPESRPATECPITGETVPGDRPTWPFANEQARLADLYRWMHGSYTITREIKDADLEQGE